MTRLLLLAALLALPAEAHEDSFEAKVVSVTDGDTLRVNIHVGLDVILENQPVRLCGVDAPEVRTRDLEEKARGLAVAAWLAEQVLYRRVRLDVPGERKSFDRWVGRVWLGQRDIHAELLALDHVEPDQPCEEVHP